MRKERELKNTSLPLCLCLLVLLREFIRCPAQVTEDHGCGNRKAQSAYKKKTDLLLPLLLLHNSLSVSLSLCISLRESCTRQLLPEFLCNQCWLSYIYDSPLPRAGKAQVLQLQREIEATGAPMRVSLPCWDLGEKQEEEKKQSNMKKKEDTHEEQERKREKREAMGAARECGL
jgi:hypothetical protein